MNRANLVYNIKNQLSDGDDDYAGRIYERVVHIPSSEVLTLYSVPKEIVPAQGAGKVIEFISAVLFLDYGTTQYVTAGNLRFHMATTGTIVSDQIDTGDFMDEAADTYRVVQALSQDISLEDNEALTLMCKTADPTAGDSPIGVRVAYRIHDFN